ncbi:MAG TPA: TonB-dependent siderophore receptor [Burkholderiales bacterium]|nr:TonB-dependent siderophore receptor [Burkholderiales bacterium]
MPKRFKRRPLAAALFMIFSAPVPAEAQSEATLPEVKVKDASGAEGFRTDSTRSATRTDTPLRDIPQFINVVPQALIRSQGATTLSDALRNVPGISYAAAEGGTQANQVFFLRGFPVNEDLFIDGVRDLGEYNRDLFATESVEVLKGSSALMFGRGSTGGLINQVSKVADRLERKEVAVTYGSFEQKRATADVNMRTGDSSALRLIALAEDSGSYRYPRGVQKVGFAPSLWANVGNATDITLQYYYLNERSVTDYGQPTIFANGAFYGFAPVSAQTYYGFANSDYANYQTQIGTFRIEHQFSNTLSLRNTLRYADYKRQSESTIAQGVNPTDANGAPVTAATPPSLLLVTRTHDTNRTRDNDDTALINQTELTWNTSGWGIDHTVLGGLELAQEKLNRWNYQLDADPNAAGVQNPSVVSPLLAPNPYQPVTYTKVPNLRALAEGDTAAMYGQDQLQFNRYWKGVIGLRYERFKASAQQLALINPVVGTPQPQFSRTDNMLSGRAGVIWQPTDRQSYYVSWGNSYNPSGELGVYGGVGNTNLSATNQNVGPEKSQNYEIGAQWDVLYGLQLRSALFRNEKTNARLVLPVEGVTTLGGKRRVDGIEFEASGSITRNWDIYSGIAYMDGTIVQAATFVGNTPLGVSRVAGNVWTIYRLGEGWEVGGGVRGQTGAWLTDQNLPGSQIPGYAVWDATAAYVQKKYEVRVNLFNLGDKVYYVGGYNNSPNRVIPGQPRAAALTVRYNF